MRSLLLPLLCLAACSSGRKTLIESDPLTAPTEPFRLRVVTFNVQDLFVADRRAERLRAIGHVLGECRPDVVALQEAFTSAHRAEFLGALQQSSGETYHAVYFPSGWMGSGLYIASRHPIVRATFWRYSKNGAWHQVKHGDWYAGKGVAAVRLRICSGHVDVFNTHLIANYLDAVYTEDRRVQIGELSAFISQESQVPAPAIVLGDLNCGPRGDLYKALLAGPPALTDPLGEIAPELGGRIDHILVRPRDGFVVKPLDLRRLHTGKGDDGQPLDLSDHPGYMLTLQIRPTD